MIKSLKILALAATAAMASATVVWAADVALFTNNAYVDYRPGALTAEASNLEATLTQQGHQVSRFTAISAPGLKDALAGRDALLIPDLEKNPSPTLYNALDVNARAEIVEFVNGGGSLVFFQANAKSLELVNNLFGYSLATGTTAFTYLVRGDANGTAFQGGPPRVLGLSGTATLDPGTYSSVVRSIYASTSADAVTLIPQGRGYVIHIGWDWLNAFPTGTEDTGWLHVLNAAVNQAVDPSKADVALLANNAYVNYFDNSNSANPSYEYEASNVQASVQNAGHKVMPFTDISASGLSNVLQGRDALMLVDTVENTLYSDLSQSARETIIEFVNEGGRLYILQRSTQSFINLLFFGLSVGGGIPQSSYGLDASEAADTPFTGGPVSLAAMATTSALDHNLMPPGSRSIYRSGSNVAVASIPVGCGGIAYFGWDWFDAAPIGINDGGWLEVLDRSLDERRRRYVTDDFNGDTQGDVLWRHVGTTSPAVPGTGSVFLYLMDDSEMVDAQGVGGAPMTWDIAGTGDFDGDCKADILWRHSTTGRTVIWLMNGFQRKVGQAIGAPPPVWQVADVLDYNGDRRSDILWRNSSGNQLYVWEMDGVTRIDTKVVTTARPGTAWQVQPD